VVKVELQVPQRLANKLNGRGGELIQEIRSSSLAKLNIDPNGRNGKAKITIVGNGGGIKFRPGIERYVSCPLI